MLTRRKMWGSLAAVVATVFGRKAAAAPRARIGLRVCLTCKKAWRYGTLRRIEGPVISWHQDISVCPRMLRVWSGYRGIVVVDENNEQRDLLGICDEWEPQEPEGDDHADT